MKNNNCCSASSTTTVLACSGGSNVGQIANEAAKLLDTAGEAKFFCLAGVGGHISGMIASVEGCNKVLVLDGCPVACAKKAMDAANIKGYTHITVTNLGIEKVHDFKLSDEQINQVLSACRAEINGSSTLKENSNETKLVETSGDSGSCRGGGCCSCE
ncbi:MAG: putative zinc-binding protein [Armatimonadota bacterium]